MEPDNDFKILEYPPQAGRSADVAVRTRLYDPMSGLLIGGVTNRNHPTTLLFSPVLQAKFDDVRRVFPEEGVTLQTVTASLDRMVVRTDGPGLDAGL